MTTATTTAAAATSTCGPSTYILPTKDAACAIPNTANHTSIMDKCCSPASVEHYSDDCGLYCLAQEQSLGDLLDCLRHEGARNGDVFCNDQLNATATADPTASKTGSAAEAMESEGAAGRVGIGGWGVLGIVLGSVPDRKSVV